MKNIRQQNPSSSVKVSYITTQGKIGNTPQVGGEDMENKKVPGIEQKVPVIVSATGGADRASVDHRLQLLRYYSLTNDRLYTKMDIDAFLRKEIVAEFREEHTRIFIKINIEGAGGATKLQRGLYIDIEFKDKKNYERAVSISFDKLMQQRIMNKSCISMPIFVELKNLEE
jgi:hypothetical protein